MKVLYITNMYPTVKKPYYGVFVYEQICGIAELYSISSDIYCIDGYKSRWNYLFSIRKINEMIIKGNYDLVHIHYGLAGLFLLLGNSRHIPIVMTLHGGDIQKKQKKYIQVFLTKLILRKVSIAITLNEQMDKVVKKIGIQSCILPCAVDTQNFVPLEKSEDTGIVKILFPSDRSRIEKNYGLFLEVIAILRNTYKISIKEVELIGMNRQQVADCLCNVDLLLMTSDTEGSPQIVKEAMACNLPVVSTPVGDVKLLLYGVQNCIVTETFQAKELAAAVYKVIKQGLPGIEGRKKIISLGLDKQNISDKIYKIYESLTK